MSTEHEKFHWSESMKYVAEALKGALLLNGAAAISTLTFLGNSKSGDDRLVFAMVFFAMGALLSPLSFACAYLTQLQYGNSNQSLAVKFHWAAYILFMLGLLMFGVGVCKAAQAFLAV